MSTAVPPDAPSPRGTARPSMFWRLWGGLRSLRFALVLMVLIALACIVGTLVRQQPYDPHRAMDTYGRSLGLLVGLLGLNHLYYTWWFLALLLLFVLSTVACTLPRLRLRRRMLGSAIVHLSIVFIVVGAMLRGLIGVEGKVQINEGQTVDEFWVAGSEEPTPLGFKLRLDDFDLRHYEEVEDVLVVRFERTEASRLIRVGRDDIVSFQRGRGPVQRLGSVADLRVTPRTIKTQNLPAKAGKIAKLRDYDATVEVLQVLPDFTLPGSGGAHGASHAHSSPALEVCVRDAAGEHTGWVLLNEWGFHPKVPESDTEGLEALQARLQALEDQLYRAGPALVVQFDGEPEQRVAADLGKPVQLRPDGTTLEVLQLIPHYRRTEAGGVVSKSDKPVNPAIEVRLRGPAGESTRWLFMKFPDFGGHGGVEKGPKLRYVLRSDPALDEELKTLRTQIAASGEAPAPAKASPAMPTMLYVRDKRVSAFESQLSVLDDNDAVLRQANVLVNSPLKYGGYMFYQVSYDQDAGKYTVLEVVYDPGVPFVFLGFLLMPLGIAYVFYIQPALRRKARNNV